MSNAPLLLQLFGFLGNKATTAVSENCDTDNIHNIYQLSPLTISENISVYIAKTVNGSTIFIMLALTSCFAGLYAGIQSFLFI